MKRQWYLWSSTADLTNITIMDLGWFGRLFWFQLFVLEWCLFSKGGPCPSSCGSGGGSCRCCLFLLLLLLLIIRWCSWIDCSLIARVRGTFKNYKRESCMYKILVIIIKQYFLREIARIPFAKLGWIRPISYHFTKQSLFIYSNI